MAVINHKCPVRKLDSSRTCIRKFSKRVKNTLQGMLKKNCGSCARMYNQRLLGKYSSDIIH